MDDKRNNHHHLGVQQNFQVPIFTVNLINMKPNNSQLRHSTPSDFDKQLFGCRYCTRVFFSSQALGGHMNAHRKESRAAFKRPSNNKNNQLRKTTSFPASKSLPFLGFVAPHALSLPETTHKFGPRRDHYETEARVPDLNEGDWPRSFRADQHIPAADVSEKLDLELRL